MVAEGDAGAAVVSLAPPPREGPPPAAHAAPGFGRRLRPWGPTLLVAGVCVAVLLGWHGAFYDTRHPVVDHVAYEVQAEQLLEGHLVVPDDVQLPPAVAPFTAPAPDGRAFKYLPGTAAVGAASIWLSGDIGLALAATLALVAVSTSGAAGALGWSPSRRALAAALVAASPVVLSNGAALLSYVPALACLTTALWLVLAATGPHRRPHGDPLDLAVRPAAALAGVTAAGLLLGATLLVRQVEVVAWIGVFVIWCALRPGATPRTRGLQAAALLAGTVPGVVAVLVLDHHITGNALQIPFTLVSPTDRIGWGSRKVFSTDAAETFTLVKALRTTPRATFDLLMWTLLGPALAVGAVIATWVRRHSPAHMLLVALGLIIPVVFLFTWANAHAVQAGFYMRVGPFYLLPCIPPLVLLGVDGLAQLPRKALGLIVVAALALQLPFLVDHLGDQVTNRTERALVDAGPVSGPPTQGRQASAPRSHGSTGPPAGPETATGASTVE